MLTKYASPRLWSNRWKVFVLLLVVLLLVHLFLFSPGNISRHVNIFQFNSAKSISTSHHYQIFNTSLNNPRAQATKKEASPPKAGRTEESSASNGDNSNKPYEPIGDDSSIEKKKFNVSAVTNGVQHSVLLPASSEVLTSGGLVKVVPESAPPVVDSVSVDDHKSTSVASGYLHNSKDGEVSSNTSIITDDNREKEASISEKAVENKLLPQNQTLPMCPLTPTALIGPIKVWFDDLSFDEILALYPYVKPGGHAPPENCLSRTRVAVIIPYRNREPQLRTFLHNMHSLLHKQQLDYVIFVVDQIEDQLFNRAKLMNIGYAEANKLYDFQCFIFHDVDLLPEDDRNLYNCPEQPRHMSVAIDKFNYRLPYGSIFGGITAFTKEQFQAINGYSNDFWGWGGEDDEIASRVRLAGFSVSRYSEQIARYKMIRHAQEKTNPTNACRYNLMYKVKQRWQQDGLSSLQYQVLSVDFEPLFMRIKVDLLEKESRAKLDSEGVCAKKQ